MGLAADTNDGFAGIGKLSYLDRYQYFAIHRVSGNDYIREDKRGQGTKIQILK
jgi:hypothetical protein